MKGTNSGGITLVELLVVVLIIVVLAAIALPSYQAYITKAKVEEKAGYLVVQHGNAAPAELVSFGKASAIISHGPGAESVFPAAVERRFANAVGVFNTPSSIPLGTTQTIKLVLSQTKTESQLVSQVYQYGESKSVEVRVGRVMQAKLVSDDSEALTITEKTPHTQSLLPSEDTYWVWDVRARKPGKYILTLTISVDSDIDGVQMQRAMAMHEEDIEVVVSTWARVQTFAGENWQWLWALLVAPVIAIFRKRIAAWWKERRGRKPKEAQ